ncbi:MAG TPA: ATP-binding protein, partial [Chitinophagaceae bacterium]|nr:ATP-binding protein [Chitinophagaceae bacterium]
ELSTIIEEKKAVIQSEGLPDLKVIPFQIEQLFINLLSNSLKYTRPGVPPVISISSQTVAAKDVPGIKADPQKLFARITFTDNGLGFEQQFAENIFVLFKRLHQKNEYPGTGIGLSICRKIADNHSGFISATGKPGEGASFSLFLPV